MERYQTLYRLHILHDYFNERPCNAFGCRLSPQGVELARQRNLLLRQTAANEWSVLYDCDSAGFDAESDILTLELYITDPAFMLYTAWQDFRPSDVHELELSGTEMEIDAAKSIRTSDKRRDIGSCFCVISLHLTDDMRQEASKKESKQTILHFHTRMVKWEYIFFQRNGNNIQEKELKLEDMNNKIAFLDLKPTTAYGNNGVSATTKEAIPMRATYRSRLRLVQQQSDNMQKRILLSNVEPPTPGRFMTKDKNIIRQVCYY